MSYLNNNNTLWQHTLVQQVLNDHLNKTTMPDIPRDAYPVKENQTKRLPFEAALVQLKNGHKLQREGWNGKGQFVVMMPALYLPPYNTQGTERKVNDRTAKWIGEDAPLDCQPYMALYNAQKQWQPGWLPSQGDLFANDWQIVD